jgi:hypothetical protein
MDLMWLTIVSAVLNLIAFPSLMGILWKDLHDKKKENSEERKKKRTDELKASVREVVVEEITPIKRSVESVDSKLDLVSNGTLSTLRNEIKNCFYECVDKGYRNDYDFKNIYELYESYVGLGGNSFIKDIMNRFESLPTKDEFDRKNGFEQAPVDPVPMQKIRVQKIKTEGVHTDGK